MKKKGLQNVFVVIASVILIMSVAVSYPSFAVAKSYVPDATGTITVTYGMQDDEEVEIDGLYYLFVVKGVFAAYDNSKEYDYNYMGQVTAQDYKVEFSFRLQENVESTVFLSSNKFNTPILLGYVRKGVTGLKTPDKITLKYKQTQTIVPEITPKDADGYTITWVSSNPSIVTVDDTGKVQAIGKPRLFRYLFHRSEYTVNVTATISDSLTGEILTSNTAVSVTYTLWQLLFPFFA